MPYGTINADVVSDSNNGVLAPVSSVFRNRIINGQVTIDQRNAGASVSVIAGTTKSSVDMFKGDSAGGIDGVFSMQQSTTVPTTGYKNSLALTVTTANTSTSTGRYYRMYNSIEGLNLADCNLGSATAATVTLSFWVRSSIAGTYCVGFQNASFNRSYAANYTINAINTWEQKSVTLTLDTTGTWANDNTLGLRIFWDLGSGSAFQQTANSWAASNTWITSSQTNWINTNGATFYITGVQLEKGSTATSFDYRPYGTELVLCQRYYETIGLDGIGGLLIAGCATAASQQVNNSLVYKVTKRATPTVTKVGTWNLVNAAGQPTVFGAGNDSVLLYLSSSAAGQVYAQNGSGAYVTISAEL